MTALDTFSSFAFAASVVYAVIGNAVVYLLLVRRKVALRKLWAGTPGYLYTQCVRSNGAVGPLLTRFALSTDIAFVLAFIFAIPLMMQTVP